MMCEDKIRVNSFFDECHFVAFLYVYLGADEVCYTVLRMV